MARCLRSFKVRGKTYLQDKIKIPAEEPVFGLTCAMLVNTPEKIFHYSRYLPIVRQVRLLCCKTHTVTNPCRYSPGRSG